MSNVWKQFKSLIDKDAVQVAEIVSIDATAAVVELLSGDRLRVRPGVGGTAGGQVLIKSGEIIQQVSALTQYNMILY